MSLSSRAVQETVGPMAPATPDAVATPTAKPDSRGSGPSLAAIIGGVIGGCAFAAGLILGGVLVWRGSRGTGVRGVQTQLNSSELDQFSGEYRDHGRTATATTSTYHGAHKTWAQGPVEADGRERPVEAPTEK